MEMLRSYLTGAVCMRVLRISCVRWYTPVALTHLEYFLLLLLWRQVTILIHVRTNEHAYLIHPTTAVVLLYLVHGYYCRLYMGTVNDACVHDTSTRPYTMSRSNRPVGLLIYITIIVEYESTTKSVELSQLTYFIIL